MNKYLISADIEGITGVVDKSFSSSKGKNYELAKSYMISDVNAVVEGILDVDSNAKIIVRDAHGSAKNLDLHRLHPKAHLIQGWSGEMNMVTSIDKTYKGVFLVGYHVGGHNNKAVLGHTFASVVHTVKINEKLITETGISSFYAGHYDVPVVFISGDQDTIEEAKEQVPGILGAIVKTSFSRSSALSLSLSDAKNLLKETASKATKQALQGNIMPCKLKKLPAKLEIKFYDTGYNISIFKHIHDILVFDKNYKFNLEKYLITTYVESALEMFQKLNLIAHFIYGI